MRRKLSLFSFRFNRTPNGQSGRQRETRRTFDVQLLCHHHSTNPAVITFTTEKQSLRSFPVCPARQPRQYEVSLCCFSDQSWITSVCKVHSIHLLTKTLSQGQAKQLKKPTSRKQSRNSPVCGTAYTFPHCQTDSLGEIHRQSHFVQEYLVWFTVRKILCRRLCVAEEIENTEQCMCSSETG